MLAKYYLVYGLESFQIHEIISEIRTLAHKAGYNSRIEVEINAKFKWDELLNNCQNLDLFASNTLVEVALAVDHVGKQGNETLLNTLQGADVNTNFLIYAQKLNAATLKSPWVQYIQKHGVIRAVKPLTGQHWHNWIKQRFTTRGMTLENDTLQALALQYEGNPAGIAQLVTKAALLEIGHTITLADLQEFVLDQNHFNVFALTKAAIAGMPERVISISHSLQYDGVEAAIVLWAITKELRNLLKLQTAQTKHQDFTQTAQTLGIWREQISAYQAAVNRISATQLQTLFAVAARADASIKGLEQRSVWELLLSICLNLAGIKHNTMEETPI